MKKNKKKVLFVCIENACRSQIAEHITNHFYSDKYQAYSAGSNPLKKVNPKAISSLERLEVIHSGYSKAIIDVEDIPFDIVVEMGCGDKCPLIPGALVLNWDISDPKMLNDTEFDKIRDLIKEKIFSDLIKNKY